MNRFDSFKKKKLNHKHTHRRARAGIRSRTRTIGCVLIFPLCSHSVFPSLFFRSTCWTFSITLLRSPLECFNFAILLLLVFFFESAENERERVGAKKFSRKSPVRLKLQSTYICHNLYATHSNKSVGTIRGTHTHIHSYKYTKAVKKNSAHCFECERLQCYDTKSHGWKKIDNERNEFKEQIETQQKKNTTRYNCHWKRLRINTNLSTSWR